MNHQRPLRYCAIHKTQFTRNKHQPGQRCLECHAEAQRSVYHEHLDSWHRSVESVIEAEADAQDALLELQDWIRQAKKERL